MNKKVIPNPMVKTFYVSHASLVDDPEMWYSSLEQCAYANEGMQRSFVKLTVTIDAQRMGANSLADAVELALDEDNEI